MEWKVKGINGIRDKKKKHKRNEKKKDRNGMGGKKTQVEWDVKKHKWKRRSGMSGKNGTNWMWGKKKP